MKQKIFYFAICVIVLSKFSDNETELFEIAESPFNFYKKQFENHYPVEEHTVVTKDGYILLLHRILPTQNISLIQNQKKKLPIYLHHALSLDSSTWMWGITNNISLPFTLSDAGYDVWLGNSRGNYNSRNHTKYNYKTSDEYWNFTFHEIGIYDLPAVIDYILKITNSDKLHYIGHSQGSAVCFILTSELPEYNKKIASFHALTPPVFMKGLPSPYVKFLSNKYGFPDEISEEASKRPPPINLNKASQILANTCELFKSVKFCTLFYLHIFGSTVPHVDEETAIAIFRNCPQGASMKGVLHFLQIVQSGHFRQYDYGKEINLMKYGTKLPPDYDIKKITCPVFIYYSEFDLFSSFTGNIKLTHELNPDILKLNYTVPAKYEFNHLDFVHGKTAKKVIFNKIMKGIEDIERNSTIDEN